MCNTQTSGQQKGPNTDTSLSWPHCHNKLYRSQQCPQAQIQDSFFLQTEMTPGRLNTPSYPRHSNICCDLSCRTFCAGTSCTTRVGSTWMTWKYWMWKTGKTRTLISVWKMHLSCTAGTLRKSIYSVQKSLSRNSAGWRRLRMKGGRCSLTRRQVWKEQCWEIVVFSKLFFFY